ncbi:phosphatidate phosphatase App1 family protein [Thalassoglobus polymorphus]|uniref:Phosphatidate phosphatase APP1 catalytic domain-containing protein n=1 Tax=Thalassoglobus polymorphus TaxID=2527994 RepID=A0A517QRP8_9PLAN|nr:App1 family protein [Thalassoglobus polymorphus]QDT34288.1 hypothetical protein Mal48_35480 [Thalassoglobus polymorphus]
MAESRETLGHSENNKVAVHPREQVIFYRSVAHYSPLGRCWHLEVHGSIFAPTRRHIRKHVLLHLFKRVVKPEKGKQTHKRFKDRAYLFLNVNKRNKSVPIAIAEKAFELPRSSPDGQFYTTLTVPELELEPSIQVDEFGRRFVEFAAHLPEEDERLFAGEIELIPPEGISIVSDIDDTIKITNIADRRELLANTFSREFQAVPMMAKIYQDWARAGASIHYVSSSPWPLYQPMLAWLDKDEFPLGSVHLRNMKLSELRKDWKRQIAYESKRKTIQTLMRTYPSRRFILCGDSGERDAELYAEIASQFGPQVQHVAIRYIENGHHKYSRDVIRRILSNIPEEKQTVFDSPEEIPALIPDAVSS